MSTTNVRIKLRRDTASNWENVNPILLEGEVGIEIDTGRVKVGDGTTAWNDLDYIVGEKVPKGIDFNNLANSIHTNNTLTVKNNKLSVNVDNSTYVEGTALTWDPAAGKFVYKPVAASGGNIFKNLIINGDFQVWQRGKSFTINNNSRYTADRWLVDTQSSGVLSNGEIATSQSTVDLCDPFGDGSCVATYKFDGNANDLCGNYNGTWHGNEQYDTGKYGQAAKFDGSSYIDIHIDSFPSVLALSFWFKQGAIDTSKNHAYFHFSKDDGNTLVLWQAADNKKMIFDTNDNVDSSFSDEYEDNQWHHLVVISTGEVFVDGVQVLTINSVDTTQINRNFIIGADRDPSGMNDYLQNGTFVDQVRIFNRALTEDEIHQLYHEDYKIVSDNGATHHISATPDYSTEYVKPFVYRFEGRHLYNQAIQGKKLTLSFDFKSTRTGNYSVSLINKTDNSNIQSIIKTFTYTTANKLDRYVVTFDLSSFTSPVRNDNQLGFELVLFGMTDDTNLQGQPDIILDGEKITTSNTVRLEKDDQIWIDRVQLEEGDKATDFIPVPPQLSHLMCRRYYQIKPDSSLQTLFPSMRTDNPTISGSGPYYFDAEL